jgi:protein ImuA
MQAPHALEALLSHPGIHRGRGSDPSLQARCRPSGHAALDRALGGGWPRGALIELAGAPFGCGETRMLLPLLVACASENLRIALVAPPATPWLPGWQQAGIAPQQLLLIRTRQVADTLWACEQLLRQPGIGALLAWPGLPGTAALRRLRLAAGAGDACGFLFLPPAALRQPSPAQLRVRWQGRGGRFELRVVKRAGGFAAPEPVVLPAATVEGPADAGYRITA